MTTTAATPHAHAYQRSLDALAVPFVKLRELLPRVRRRNAVSEAVLWAAIFLLVAYIPVALGMSMLATLIFWLVIVVLFAR